MAQFSLSLLFSPFPMQDQTNNIQTVPDTINPAHSLPEPNVPNNAKVLVKEKHQLIFSKPDISFFIPLWLGFGRNPIYNGRQNPRWNCIAEQ